MRAKPTVLSTALQAVLLAVLFSSFLVAPGMAQSGMFRATVVDSAGEPIPGVQVTVTSEDLTSFRRALSTDKRGNFRVRFQSNQAQYRFDLLFEKPGFQSFTVPLSPTMTQEMNEQYVMDESSHEVVESLGDLSAVLTGSSNAAIEAFNLGLTAQKSGDLATARQRFGEAVAADPELRPALIALGQVQLDQQDYAVALETADRALSSGEASVDALRVKYQALRALGREAEADEIGASLEQAEGAVAAARRVYNEGGDAFQAGDHGTALTKFREAIELDPSLTEAHHAVATLELAQGNYEAASTSAEKALALGSEDINTLRVLYDAYDAQGRVEELAEIAPRLAAVDPDYGGGKLLEQAASAWNSGQTERAVSLSQLALTMDPSLAKAHYFIGLNHLSKGDNASAKAALEKFIAMAPEDPDAATARDMISYID
ncbi:MAG: tetratricopeptide repeat protein [Thermoanaerobaculia bacterium]|nr:tetratricopeptide repeat protein [Thermoanaerobaculia bacterium]